MASLTHHGGRRLLVASGSVQIHLGMESDFRAAKKAHPGLRCVRYDDLLARLHEHGVAVQEADLPGQRRSFVADPFGNRIELIAQ